MGTPDAMRESDGIPNGKASTEQAYDSERWNQQHADFLGEYRHLIERDGIALEQYRSF